MQVDNYTVDGIEIKEKNKENPYGSIILKWSAIDESGETRSGTTEIKIIQDMEYSYISGDKFLQTNSQFDNEAESLDFIRQLLISLEDKIIIE